MSSSENWKYSGQTDVTISELTKTISQYEDIVGGTNITISRTEEILDDVITYLKNISEGSTYRNTPAFVGKVARVDISRVSKPQLYVGIVSSSISPEDQSSTSFVEQHQVYIVGYVKGGTDALHAGNLTDALESMIHDCTKALLLNTTTNINTERWFIDMYNQPMTIERVIDIEQNIGEFTILFRAIARAMDYTRQIVSQ